MPEPPNDATATGQQVDAAQATALNREQRLRNATWKIANQHVWDDHGKTKGEAVQKFMELIEILRDDGWAGALSRLAEHWNRQFGQNSREKRGLLLILQLGIKGATPDEIAHGLTKCYDEIGRTSWIEIQFVEELVDADHANEAVHSEKPRLVFDPATQTVILDDEQFSVENPKAFSLYKTITERNGEPITRAGLRSVIRGLRGDKTIPNLFKKLPTKLRATIKSGPHGYWLCLPIKN